MPKRDITFEIIRLLSQRIVSNDEKYPEGAVMQKTSCMNPEDAEIIGILEGIKVFLDIEKDKEEIEIINLLIKFLEKVALSRWTKGELTNLGLRAGLKYEDVVNIGEEQAIDEADVLTETEEK